MLEHLSLPQDVRDELDDPFHASRRHYSVNTRELGCKGPLCMKAQRDEARAKHEARAIREGRTFQERTKRRHPRETELGDILIHYLVALKRQDEAREEERRLAELTKLRRTHQHRDNCECKCFEGSVAV